MKQTPYWGKVYIFLGLLFIALPSLIGLYNGHTDRVLVARPSIGSGHGGVFDRSVIYLFRHKLSGAFGMIVNKPLDPDELARLFPEGKSFPLPVYYGGPVDYPERLYLIGTDRDSGAVKIYPDPYDNDGTRVDMAYLQHLDWYDNARVYVGYSGWFPVQLNVEIVRGAWDAIDYDPVIFRGGAPEETWKRARDRVLNEMPVADKKML
ncbi:MAG: YqgE/AlgH family protein [Rhodospirillales bacterium]|nr:YqgE/AlgH family protein [Rhodospirillales bacterium]